MSHTYMTTNLVVKPVIKQKAIKQKDLLSEDKLIKDLRKNINSTTKQIHVLNEKLAKRARLLLLKTAIKVIDQNKWKIHRVDTYIKNKEHFQLSFFLIDPEEDLKSKSSKGILPVSSTNSSDTTDDIYRLTELMEAYNIGYFEIDQCILNVAYDTISFNASGDDCRDLVFKLVHKLKLKIDYASYVKTTELAEAEITARKALINDLSTTILFNV